MDKELVLSKLESLRRSIHRIHLKTPASADLLLADYDLQDIIVVNLERAVQTCVDICMHVISESELPVPATMSEAFISLAGMNVIDQRLAVRMVKAVGFRNTVVHAYQEIDWGIVYSIITLNLVDFNQFAQQVLRKIES